MQQPVYVGDHVALTRTKWGKKIYVDTEDTVVSPHVLLDGDWESWIGEFLRHRVAPGSLFVDVGAHIGWYTLLACDLVGDKGYVVAVEANPRLADLVQRSLSINGLLSRANVWRNAAWHCDTQLGFRVEPHKSGNGHPTVEGDHTMMVQACPLDSILAPALALAEARGHVQKGFAVGCELFIKIDAEGSEAQVLEGAAELLTGHSVKLLVEHHPGEQAHIARLVELGYSLSVVEHHSSPRIITLSDLSGIPDSEMLYLSGRR